MSNDGNLQLSGVQLLVFDRCEELLGYNKGKLLYLRTFAFADTQQFPYCSLTGISQVLRCPIFKTGVFLYSVTVPWFGFNLQGLFSG